MLLSAGDNVSASLYVSSVQDDEPTISYLNALGLKASAAGNHEFDRGLADLQNRISQSADFPIFGANVTDTATGKPALEPFTIVTSPDGTKIGVIGTVTTETPQLTDPSALASVNFGDTVAATNKYADQLSDGNEANGEADVIVAEYHQGVD
ncbi:nuclease, partial [Bifidobacterium aemilianum]